MVATPTSPDPWPGEAQPAPGYHDIYRRPEAVPVTPVSALEPPVGPGAVALTGEVAAPSAAGNWPSDADPEPSAYDRYMPVPGLDDPAVTPQWPERDERALDAFFGALPPADPAVGTPSAREVGDTPPAGVVGPSPAGPLVGPPPARLLGGPPSAGPLVGPSPAGPVVGPPSARLLGGPPSAGPLVGPPAARAVGGLPPARPVGRPAAGPAGGVALRPAGGGPGAGRSDRLRRLGTRVGFGIIVLVLVISGSVLAKRALGLGEQDDPASAAAARDTSVVADGQQEADDPGGSDQSGTGDPAPAPAPVAGEQSSPVDGITEAALDMRGDLYGIKVRTADLGDDLYRVSAAPQGNLRPKATADGSTVRITLEPTGRTGDTTVSVLLNADVRWRVRVGVGVQQGSVDLGGSRVRQVELAGGATTFDLTLARPRGTLPVLVTGGINRLRVVTPDAVGVRVRARDGAGQVSLGGRTRNGVARGSVFVSPGWDQATDRIDVDAVAGVGTVQVEQR